MGLSEASLFVFPSLSSCCCFPYLWNDVIFTDNSLKLQPHTKVISFSHCQVQGDRKYLGSKTLICRIIILQNTYRINDVARKAAEWKESNLKRWHWSSEALIERKLISIKGRSTLERLPRETADGGGWGGGVEGQGGSSQGRNGAWARTWIPCACSATTRLETVTQRKVWAGDCWAAVRLASKAPQSERLGRMRPGEPAGSYSPHCFMLKQPFIIW